MPRRKIERAVAETILEKKEIINIGGRDYEVAPPSIATLIMVSELSATFPIVPKDTPADRIVYAVLRYAKGFKKLGELAAILILGAKGLTEEIEVEYKLPRFFGLFKRTVKHKKIIDKKAELAKEIMENTTPSVLFKLIIGRLEQMELGSFFGITTSLSEVNLLTPTKEVESEKS